MTASPAPAPARIAVIGAGLAGSLAALALARRGAEVVLLEAGAEAATALSYGGVLGPSACRAWRQLERTHGPLGLRSARVLQHDGPAWRRSLPPRLQLLPTLGLTCLRLDVPTLLQALPAAQAAAGVARLALRVQRLQPVSGGWRLELAAPSLAPSSLQVEQVVLAAGAGCRRLWPALGPRLRTSWAGVLQLESVDATGRWAAPLRRGWLVLPRRWRRPALEASAPQLTRADWIVDAGLVPFAAGALAGQITLVNPGVDAGPVPEAGWMEARLRQGLARIDPALAALPGRYRQVAVPFCPDGQPLLGPLPDAPGLWPFSGFRAAFGVVPQLAEQLAESMLGPRS
ncbi:MAG: FAD-dependent oxidoreductase [Synechococcaceae cyanobacterium]|nr:FAD-dependent oxidoreductase [Synechococcaceae cyanobacterium]